MLSKCASQAAVQHSIEMCAEFQAIAVSDGMDGAAHERDAYHAAVKDELRELVRIEAFQPRPQGEIRSIRCLCLQAHQVCQGGQNCVVERQRSNCLANKARFKAYLLNRIALGLRVPWMVEFRIGIVHTMPGQPA